MVRQNPSMQRTPGNIMIKFIAPEERVVSIHVDRVSVKVTEKMKRCETGNRNRGRIGEGVLDIAGVVTTALGRVILTTAENKIKSAIQEKKWKELFIETGDFFVTEVERANQLMDDIAVALSKENMIELAKDVNDKNGYRLVKKLKEELTNIMVQYEIPYDKATFYIKNFIIVIIDQIRKNNPKLYDEIYLSEWRDEEKRDLEIIKQHITEVFKLLRQISHKKLEIYSIDQMDIKIRQETHNPQISLNFFESDDDNFIDEITSRLDEEIVYVTGKCREEIVYCVLNILRKQILNRTILVIKRKEDWEGLSQLNIKNAILIPWFYDEEIVALADNTNIFIYGEEEQYPGKNPIHMRRRTKKTLRTLLMQAGMDSKDAYKLIEDTHGLYIPMKKRIYKGLYTTKKPKWVDGEVRKNLAVLLVGQWTESEGDKLIVSQVAQCSYEDLVHYLEPFMVGEDPLVQKVKIYGKTSYRLASLENTWDYLNPFLDNNLSIWERFIENLREVIIESEPIFNYPVKEHFLLSTKTEQSFWSPQIRKGMLKSLIMKAYYKKDDSSQEIVDKVVYDILNEINTPEKWLYITQYFQDLCEASPEIIMDKLEEELKKDTGLLSVFTNTDSDIFFGRNYYTEVLWGVEQLLSQKYFSARAVRWLLHIDNLSIRYPMNNSPRETLKNVFHPWVNLTPLNTDGRLKLATEAFAINVNSWEMFFGMLSDQMTTVVSELSKPEYRDVSEWRWQPYVYEVNKCYCSYFELLLLEMDFSCAKWIKMLRILGKLPSELHKQLFDKLEYELFYMDDAERINIKNAIRYQIYRHRYFSTAEWTMSEDLLSELECFMYKIKVERRELDFVYLFINRYNFPLLNPMPYAADSGRKCNEQAIEKEISNKIKVFKESGCSIAGLSEACSAIENNTLGTYLAKYYCEGDYYEDVMVSLLCAQKSGYMAIDYIRYFYFIGVDVLKKAIRKAKEVGCSDDIIAKLCCIEMVGANKVPLVELESEEVKRIYWNLGHEYEKSEDVISWQIEECIKYGTQSSILRLLGDVCNMIEPDKLLQYMICCMKMELGSTPSMLTYDLENVLTVLQETFIRTEFRHNVIEIELYYSALLEWSQMKCIEFEMQLSPDLYAEIIAYVYRKDNHKENDASDKDKQRVELLFRILFKAKFCPANDRDKVDYDQLILWIEKFKKLLTRQGQARLFHPFLGELLANSPIGDDQHYPCEAVRRAIEKYGNRSLKSSYSTAVCNMRGVFTVTAGKEERAMAKKYKENADALVALYPKTAAIYYDLHERYMREYCIAREEAELIGY